METEYVLPPQVCGHPTGELVVKVDEIFWLKNSPGDIFVHLQWWGEKSYNVFWPADLNHRKESKDGRPNSVTYTIRTSPALFQTYVKNSRELTFYVVKEADRTIVGTASVKDLVDILVVKTYSSYSSYYPIYNLQKSRIGDLRVSFSLFLKKNADLTDYKAETLPKKCSVVPKSVRGRRMTRNRHKAIAAVVSRGQDLRKAMVKSVLKDCPPDRVDTLIDTKNNEGAGDKLYNSKINEGAGDKLSPVATPPGKALKKSEIDARPPTSLSNTDEFSSIKSSNKVQDSIGDDFNVFYSSQNTSTREIVKTKIASNIGGRAKSPTNRIRSSSAFAHINEGNKKEARLIGNYKILHSMDCFRFTIREIRLSQAGTLKVSNNPTPTVKQIRANHPPGTLFSVEFRLPAKSLHRMSRKPTVFISKKVHGSEITFGDSLAMKLPAGFEDNPWLKVSRMCATAEIKVYWRHLNQRLPTTLGSALIPQIKVEEIEDLTSTLNLSLPIIASPKLVGKIYVCFELGRNNKAFGENLFKCSKSKQENLVRIPSLTDLNSDISKEEKSSEKNEVAKFPLKENTENNELISIKEKRLQLPISSITTESSQSDFRNEIGSEVMKVIDALNKKLNNIAVNDVLSEKNYFKNESGIERKHSDEAFKESSTFIDSAKAEDIKEEKNLNKEKEDEIKESHKHKCCCCCKRCCHNQLNTFRSMSDQKENSMVHEFTISIHKVSNFPLFTKDHDMDCFVDYRFPYVSPIDASLSLNTIPFSTETTIALRNTHFSTVHTHKLKLSKSLTEALVSLQKQDLTLRLWARMYHPVPRDHKVAKARIPLTKLTSMEFKFEQEMLQGSVAEKLKVPLDTVRSSLTSGLQGHCENGYIIIGIHYRRYDALRGPTNEARSIVDFREKNIKTLHHNFEEDYFTDYHNFDKGRSKLSSHSQTYYDKQTQFSSPPVSPDIPELDVGSATDKKQGFINSSCRFDNSLSRELPSRDFINIADSPFSNVNFDTKRLIPLRSQSSFTPRPFSMDKRPTSESLTSSNDDTNSSHIKFDGKCSSSRLHAVELHPPPSNISLSPPLSPTLHRSVDLYSSQDPLQMRKDLVGCKISEEFEVLSEPSFLAATSPPRVERDFPPGVTTNLDITSFITHDDNPFEDQYLSKNVDKEVDGIDLDNVLPTSNRMSVCVAVETDSQASENKSTQTSLVQPEAPTDSQSLTFSAFSDEWFMARVCIERAINLPLVSPVPNKDSDLQLIKPTTYVQFRAKSGDEVKVIRTVSIPNSTSPVWDSTWQLQLPSAFLYKNDEDFELYVGCSGQTEPLGKVCIDLTALSAGLSTIDGWYLISDGIRTSGQIKVMVTPLEDVSKFKDKWLKEYSESKQRKKMELGFELPKKEAYISSSKFETPAMAPSIGNVDDAQLAASLRFKISEMESLTEQMKKKIIDKNSWKARPPNVLLGRVNDFMTSLENTDKLVNSLKLFKNEASGNLNSEMLLQMERNISLKDSGDSPVIISDDDDNEDKSELRRNKNEGLRTVNSSFSDLQQEDHLIERIPLIDLTEDHSDSSQATLDRVSSLEEYKANGEESFNTYILKPEPIECSDDSLEIVSYNNTDLLV